MNHLRLLTLPLLLATLLGLAAQERADPPRGSGPAAPGGASAARRTPDRGALAFTAHTVPKNDREKAVLAVLEDMDRTQRRGSLSVPVADGRLLRALTEAVGAKHVVEIGTSIGYSGLWFCLALESTGGRLTTFEIDPQKVAIATANFKRAGMDPRATIVLGDAHQEVTKFQGPIDVLFLDADKEGYLDYLEKLLPQLKPGALVIAHNINERQADPKFIEAITTRPELETSFLNVGNSGLSLSVRKR